MSTRDFIEDSLYNPNYGYFSKHATIFNSSEPFDFSTIPSGHHFNRMVDERYVEFEDKLDKENRDDTRQLWHTPTELFRPYYSEAIARYLIAHYRLTLFPYYDLIIYEMGAGNGTLMMNVLDHIRDFDAEVYQRTKFRIVEISSPLADLQARNAAETGHSKHVEILRQSIFDWNTLINSPCFFLALEVIDNFAHDSIRYDPSSAVPLQGNVLIDKEGEFYEFYDRNIDPVAARYLDLRKTRTQAAYKKPLSSSKFLRQLRYSLPLAPNLSLPEYIPTRLMQFFEILHAYFPWHRLIVADFNYLPDAVPGINAPVVQTRYRRRNVQVSTPFVHQGYFDVFFPTNFALMEDVYKAITGKLTRLSTHRKFLERWAYVQDTVTRNGENPMLTWYENASVMTST
ncbi:MAG: hypothetical protein Q9227_007452 [Pyrenula ochraceoflavens]